MIIGFDFNEHRCHFLVNIMISNHMDDVLCEFHKFHRLNYLRFDELIKRRMLKSFSKHYNIVTVTGAKDCFKHDIMIKIENIEYDSDNALELFRESLDNNRADIAREVMRRFQVKIRRYYPNYCDILMKDQLPPSYLQSCSND